MLEEEFKRLKNVERPRIVKEIEEARSHGDISENAEYHAAKERQGLLEGRIRDSAKVLLAKKLHADKSLEIDDICKTLRMSRSTFYRYLRL